MSAPQRRNQIAYPTFLLSTLGAAGLAGREVEPAGRIVVYDFLE